MKIKYSIFLIYFFVFLYNAYTQSECQADHPIPFSTDSTHLTVWDGEKYIPFFVKGVNFGVSLPGRFPGELEVSRAQYGKWFQLIKDAGFNNIRVYTLHYPHFYEVLDSFNTANPTNPLFIFQGIWLDEENDENDLNLYSLTDTFIKEIEDNINCVHGNNDIPHRFGKAYGLYTSDISKWNIGYIIGREIHGEEVIHTDEVNSDTPSFFYGNFFSIENATPTEVWATKKLEHLVSYEQQHYQTQRPLSMSSWPTLDPLHHPTNWMPLEDTATIDLSKLILTNAPAGYFASYHAYPYYPDFISTEPSYQEYSDNYGPNSYIGYLTDLKNHYNMFPLIIAEYGIPSSWGIAHYAHSGMNHGGYDELEQGRGNIRMLNNIKTAQCGGGIQFALIDEWFKRTWITDPLDYLSERRLMWHNITGAEQNYGLLGYRKKKDLNVLQQFCDTCAVKTIRVGADYSFFHAVIDISKPFSHPDVMWIGIDTYSEELGESILPNGQQITKRAEFALKITNHTAELYVTEAYDLFEIWHQLSGPNQLFRSVPTDGAPWYIVRWRNNSPYEHVQYIGKLQLNNGLTPQSSQDAVTIYNDSIVIRLPWTLLHVIDPGAMRVFHDDRATPEPEDTISDGFALSVVYKNQLFETDERYVWEQWDMPDEYEEYIKTSYWVMQDNLQNFNTPAIGRCDVYDIVYIDSPVSISVEEGVLKNDFDMDGDILLAYLFDAPSHGYVHLQSNGAFEYTPLNGFSGMDMFTYTLFDGYSLSSPTTVFLNIDNISSTEYALTQSIEINTVSIFPNPVNEITDIRANEIINLINIFNSEGKLLSQQQCDSKETTVDLSGFESGIYILKIDFVKGSKIQKIVKM